MYFKSIKKGLTVVIRTPEGEKEGRALRKEDDAWILEGGLVATPASIVRYIPKPRGGGGKAAPPTGDRSSSAGP